MEKHKKIDTKAIEYHITGILKALGDNPEREGLKDTPKRVAKMYEEVFDGMNYTNEEIADMFNKTFALDMDEEESGQIECNGQSGTSNMVVVKDIDIFSVTMTKRKVTECLSRLFDVLKNKDIQYILYADIDINICDGSSVWYSSMINILSSMGRVLVVSAKNKRNDIALWRM